MNLTVPILIVDELEDEVIESRGQLDLASGEIHQVQYTKWDLATQGLPADREDYEFTSGTLSHDGKDVEFKVDVDVYAGRYSVAPNELLDIKVKAAKLFAGIDGQQLLEGAASSGKRRKLH
jgi:hypothetical protein